MVQAEGITEAMIEQVVARERKVLERRELGYRGHAGTPQMAGQTVILVDDGVATGATMEAAVKALRRRQVVHVCLAVPVSSREAHAQLKPLVDDWVSLMMPERFRAVGEWYEEFPQVADAEVTRLQWDENSGYCGEVSIQSIALFYGTYISQYRVRAIIDPTQQQDTLVPHNSGPIFDALRLNYAAWNSDSARPQYQPFLVWVKGHLAQKHPVIFDVFSQGLDDPDYDHIITATGFTSPDTTRYHDTDTLVFNDNPHEQLPRELL